VHRDSRREATAPSGHLQHIYPTAEFLEDGGILLWYSTHGADPDGGFGRVEVGWPIGGAMCCQLGYPK